LHIIFEDAFLLLEAVVAVCAETNILSADTPEACPKTFFLQHPQSFSQNILSSLLPWAATNANDIHNDQNSILFCGH
jgi:hypothetical protein